MEYLATAQEIKTIEAYVIRTMGIPSLVLMEKAAQQVRDRILFSRISGKVLIFCGNGNNGADGLALARLLSSERGFAVTVIVKENGKESEEYQCQKKLLSYYPVSVLNFCELLQQKEAEYAVLVDAIFGFGLNREITGEYLEWIDWMNRAEGYKLSVDLPSGISADDGQVLGVAVRADETVTFSYAKPGLLLYPGAAYAGRVQVCSIGFPENIWQTLQMQPGYVTDPKDKPPCLPPRKKDGHKGTFGKVMVIGGFGNMPGAAVMAGRAALQSGAGMLRLVSSQENRDYLLSMLPEAQFTDHASLADVLDWADVIVIGPGLGQDGSACAVLRTVLEEYRGVLLLDADALNLLANTENGLEELLLQNLSHFENVILTPHPGEYKRLSGGRVLQLFEETKEHSLVLVRKDARTMVSHTRNENGRKPIYINQTGNSGMGTGGSGDVLSGIIGGLVAQSRGECFEMVCLGTYLHGLCGDLAAEEKTAYAMTATDLIGMLPRALSMLQKGIKKYD